IALVSPYPVLDLGATSKTVHGQVQVMNKGKGRLALLFESLEGSSQFQAAPPAVASVASAESTLIDVAFTPSGSGPRSATLHLTTHDPDRQQIDIELPGT